MKKFIYAFIVVVLGIVGCSCTTSAMTKYKVSYHDLINNNKYETFNSGDAIRYYLTINGIISDQFVDVADKDDPKVAFTQKYNERDKITVLPILHEYDTTNTSMEEKHLIYIVKNNIATPVLISYVIITEDDYTYLDTVCRNLNNNEYIDYEDINTIPED